jgi:hypothetical protein
MCHWKALRIRRSATNMRRVHSARRVCATSCVALEYLDCPGTKEVQGCRPLGSICSRSIWLRAEG